MDQLTKIARTLNRARLNVAPCPWLPALSVFSDEEYENYELDMIGPKDRRRITGVLKDNGFRQKSGRVLLGKSQGEGEGLRLEFPAPTRLISGDPAVELERVLAAGKSVPFGTPTQVVLATLRQEDEGLGPEREADLVALVHEQPANLDKVWDQLRDAPDRERLEHLRRRLTASQREGTQLRQKRAFRSRLPR